MHNPIKEARLARGISQARLAQLAGITRPTIAKMENLQSVRADMIQAVCNVLGLDYEQVLTHIPVYNAVLKRGWLKGEEYEKQ